MALPTTNVESAAPVRSRWASILGIFVVWQLIYLPLSNAIQFVPVRVLATRGEEPLFLQEYGTFTKQESLQRAADVSRSLLIRYAEVSGQSQFWKLFTPEMPPQSIGLYVIAKYRDGNMETLADTLPESAAPSYRMPKRDIRIFHFESSLVYGPWDVTPDCIVTAPQHAQDSTIEYAKGKQQAFRVYFQYLWSKRYSGEYPLQFELQLKCISKKDDQRSATTVRPYIRWTPTTDVLEVYDPVNSRYIALQQGAP